MRALVQRVKMAEVTIGGKPVGTIAAGLLILLGVTHDDDADDAVWLADKCVKMRIFEDDAGLMNRSVLDTGGEILVVSQFTLYGDAAHGRRPSFTAAARPEHAEPLYRRFLAALRQHGVTVATGEFGADMLVSSSNAGPVTLLVESPL